MEMTVRRAGLAATAAVGLALIAAAAAPAGGDRAAGLGAGAGPGSPGVMPEAVTAAAASAPAGVTAATPPSPASTQAADPPYPGAPATPASAGADSETNRVGNGGGSLRLPAEAAAAARAVLVRECDAWLAAAERRAPGWAWGDGGAAVDAGGRKVDPKIVSMAPRGTPAVGLLLHLAGAELSEPRYTEAARQAGRAVAASVDRSGRVPRRAMFGRSSVSRDDPENVPDRSATVAGVALLLALGDDRNAPLADLYRGAALRGSFWLLHQRTAAGFWPVGDPPAAPVADTSRVVRLDTTDYRDATVALLLAGDALKQDVLARGALQSTLGLDKLKVTNIGEPGRGLWAAYYSPAGDDDNDRGPHPGHVDLLATRHVVQTLWIAHLLTRDRDAAAALDPAVKAIEALGRDHVWRRYPVERADATENALPPTSPPSLPFGSAESDMLPPQAFGGFDDFLDAYHAGIGDGPDAVLRTGRTGLGAKTELLLALTGVRRGLLFAAGSVGKGGGRFELVLDALATLRHARGE